MRFLRYSSFVWVLTLASLFAPQSANGAVINTIGGGGGVISPVGVSSVFSVIGNNFVSTTTPPVSPLNIFGDTTLSQLVKMDPFTVDLTNWKLNPDSVGLSSSITLVAQNSVVAGITAGDTVTFNITGSTGIMSFTPSTFVIGILADVTFASQTGFTGFDFSSIKYLSVSAQVAAATPDGPGTIDSGNGSTASFTLTNALPNVPEPSTLVIGAMFFGIFSGRIMLRRRGKNPASLSSV